MNGSFARFMSALMYLVRQYRGECPLIRRLDHLALLPKLRIDHLRASRGASAAIVCFMNRSGKRSRDACPRGSARLRDGRARDRVADPPRRYTRAVRGRREWAYAHLDNDGLDPVERLRDHLRGQYGGWVGAEGRIERISGLTRGGSRASSSSASSTGGPPPSEASLGSMP